MPKQKRHSGAKKRFKLTATGKLMRKRAMKAHNLEHKSPKRKRRFGKDQPVSPADAPRVQKQLGI
jgi:large subunit ribosomal protein L35